MIWNSHYIFRHTAQRGYAKLRIKFMPCWSKEKLVLWQCKTIVFFFLLQYYINQLTYQMASLFVADKQNIPHVSRNTQFAVTSWHGNRVGEASKQYSSTWSALTRVWDLQMCIYTHKAHTAGSIRNIVSHSAHIGSIFFPFLFLVFCIHLQKHLFPCVLVAYCCHVCVCVFVLMIRNEEEKGQPQQLIVWW